MFVGEPDRQLPPDCPAGLASALADAGASVRTADADPPRVYVRATASAGELFAWYSSEPADRRTLEHELAVRAALGTEGPLRGPPVLARGPNWRLERALETEPITGRPAIAAIAAAAAELTDLKLPSAPRVARARERRAARLVRRLRTVRSPLPTNDVVRAARVLRGSKLPVVTSHGQFHLGHIFLRDDAIWLIDWELLGRRPGGFDLMQLWSDLERAEDRKLVFEAAAELVGPRYRGQLLKLRYALLVRMIATKLTEPNEAFRDTRRARALLQLLPDARSEARVA